jgi:hypothetical protein
MLATTIRFPKESEHLLEIMKKSAENNHRSLNGELLRALEFYLKNAPEAQYEVKKVHKEAVKKSK